SWITSTSDRSTSRMAGRGSKISRRQQGRLPDFARILPNRRRAKSGSWTRLRKREWRPQRRGLSGRPVSPRLRPADRGSARLLRKPSATEPESLHVLPRLWGATCDRREPGDAPTGGGSHRDDVTDCGHAAVGHNPPIDG